MRLCENDQELVERTHTMTQDKSALFGLLEELRTAEAGEVMRRLLGSALQMLIDAEASVHIGAAPHERTSTRTTQRNGAREKTVSTTAGDLRVRIPRRGRGRSSRPCCSRAGGWTRRCTR